GAAHGTSQLICKIGKVSRAVLQRRHLDESRIHALLQPRSLVVGIKEDLAPDDRPSQQGAELILLVNAALGGKGITGIEIRVAKELEHRPVKLISPRFRDDVDAAAAVISVFGVEVPRENTKFGYGVEVRNNSR